MSRQGEGVEQSQPVGSPIHPKLDQIPGHAYSVDMATARNKLLEAAMALLQASPKQRLNVVVLNKALFYLDLHALRDLGRTVTDREYVALPQGPVVDSYKEILIKPLVEGNMAEQLQASAGGYRWKPLRVKNPVTTFLYLEEREQELARYISAGFLNSFISAAVSAFSHDNPGWRIAFGKHEQGRPYVKIDMLLALQQLGGDDDDAAWLNEPLDADTMAIANAASSATILWD